MAVLEKKKKKVEIAILGEASLNIIYFLLIANALYSSETFDMILPSSHDFFLTMVLFRTNYAA